MKNEKQLLNSVRKIIQNQFEGEGTGHDWWHIVRVVNSAKSIALNEKADVFLVELSALLHDVGDHKFHQEENAQEVLIKGILTKVGVGESIQKKVLEIVVSVSYKGANVETIPSSIEGQIVQDADRLDAMGAIGIARAFAYGGNKGRLLYHPDENPVKHEDFDAYRSDKGHTINHFYEKLLLLKERMQTETGKQIAEERHAYMEVFLEQFYKEWDGR